MPEQESNKMKNNRSPFELKVRGDFEEAFNAYANDYAAALHRESRFLEEISFEQMFDIMLLKFVNEKRTFDIDEELLSEVQRVIRDKLIEKEALNEEAFATDFGVCEKRLYPGGKARTRFSVDPKILLKPEREKLGIRNEVH